MRLLAFSDLHRDLGRAESLVERSADADVVIGAGDFASVHEGLGRDDRGAVPDREAHRARAGEQRDGGRAARSGVRVARRDGAARRGGRGLGQGVLRPRRGDPDHPLGLELRPLRRGGDGGARRAPRARSWSSTRRRAGHCDVSGVGREPGLQALADAIERLAPPLAVCGHIHESWGARSRIGQTEIANLGPDGATFDV